MNRKEIKARAKEFGFNNKWNFWKGSLLVAGITFAIGFVLGLFAAIFNISDESTLYYVISTLLDLFLLPLSVGLIQYYIKLVRGEEVDLKEALLSKYKKEYIWKIIEAIIVSNVIIALFSLLLVIPGIIYALKYAMLTYILAESTPEELDSESPLKKSSELMDGYKWDYFVFQLSFIGWMLLSVLTFGILLIWVVPYAITAEIMYYDELKKLKAKK